MYNNNNKDDDIVKSNSNGATTNNMENKVIKRKQLEGFFPSKFVSTLHMNISLGQFIFIDMPILQNLLPEQKSLKQLHEFPNCSRSEFYLLRRGIMYL